MIGALFGWWALCACFYLFGRIRDLEIDVNALTHPKETADGDRRPE